MVGVENLLKCDVQEHRRAPDVSGVFVQPGENL